MRREAATEGTPEATTPPTEETPEQQCRRELAESFKRFPDGSIAVARGKLDRVMWRTNHGEAPMERGGHLGGFKELDEPTMGDVRHALKEALLTLTYC